ncbi:MAG: Acryloyl-CoA reductase electron transfer subunit gamma [Lentisphaerae bacterium ADurb.BinA184]|nr:MAG: Acryloyl-CoA reductase electron transfer subunit gamma [Lentisphaerae bacterium ADurb.BinA184]
MRIVVCVKQVPAVSQVSIDPETKRLKREGVQAALNPFDLYAIEQAVQLKENLGGEAIALSMGPRQAEMSVREAMAMGCDRGVLLCDRAFAGSDTWATSYALAAAVRRLGHVDLILCGKQAVDGDTAQVGPGLAAQLEWPQVTYVSMLMRADGDRLVVNRMHEEGYDEVEVDLPAVLTVVKDLNIPRVPTLRSVLAARRQPVEVWTAAEIGADPACLGLDGSPTRVVRTGPPPPRQAETVRLDGPADEAARRLVHDLRMKSLL